MDPVRWMAASSISRSEYQTSRVASMIMVVLICCKSGESSRRPAGDPQPAAVVRFPSVSSRVSVAATMGMGCAVLAGTASLSLSTATPLVEKSKPGCQKT